MLVQYAATETGLNCQITSLMSNITSCPHAFAVLKFAKSIQQFCRNLIWLDL